MKTKEINTNAIIENELNEAALEEVNGGLFCELAVAGAVAGAAAGAAAVGTAAALGTAAVVGGAVVCAATKPPRRPHRPARCGYTYEYYRETGYRW